MTAGLSKVTLPICKPTSRVQIWESKQSRIHYFMHSINNKYSKKERIGAIDQGFTYLVARTTQSLPLADLEGCPTSTHLINSNQKHKQQYMDKTVHQTSPIWKTTILK
jgi:hypothetical protein